VSSSFFSAALLDPILNGCFGIVTCTGIDLSSIVVLVCGGVAGIGFIVCCCKISL